MAQEADQSTVDRPRENRPFRDREKAAAAGRKGGLIRQEQARARRAAAELAEAAAAEGASPDLRAALEGRTRAQDAAIIQELERAAAKGDVASARELREWRRQDRYVGLSAAGMRIGLLSDQLGTKLQYEVMQLLLDAVKRQEEEESPAQEDNRQRSVQADQPLPHAIAET